MNHLWSLPTTPIDHRISFIRYAILEDLCDDQRLIDEDRIGHVQSGMGHYHSDRTSHNQLSHWSTKSAYHYSKEKTGSCCFAIGKSLPIWIELNIVDTAEESEQGLWVDRVDMLWKCYTLEQLYCWTQRPTSTKIHPRVSSLKVPLADVHYRSQ